MSGFQARLATGRQSTPLPTFLSSSYNLVAFLHNHCSGVFLFSAENPATFFHLFDSKQIYILNGKLARPLRKGLHTKAVTSQAAVRPWQTHGLPSAQQDRIDIRRQPTQSATRRLK
jgi:hypothetical protein